MKNKICKNLIKYVLGYLHSEDSFQLFFVSKYFHELFADKLNINSIKIFKFLHYIHEELPAMDVLRICKEYSKFYSLEDIIDGCVYYSKYRNCWWEEKNNVYLNVVIEPSTLQYLPFYEILSTKCNHETFVHNFIFKCELEDSHLEIVKQILFNVKYIDRISDIILDLILKYKIDIYIKIIREIDEPLFPKLVEYFQMFPNHLIKMTLPKKMTPLLRRILSLNNQSLIKVSDDSSILRNDLCPKNLKFYNNFNENLNKIQSIIQIFVTVDELNKGLILNVLNNNPNLQKIFLQMDISDPQFFLNGLNVKNKENIKLIQLNLINFDSYKLKLENFKQYPNLASLFIFSSNSFNTSFETKINEFLILQLKQKNFNLDIIPHLIQNNCYLKLSIETLKIEYFVKIYKNLKEKNPDLLNKIHFIKIKEPVNNYISNKFPELICIQDFMLHRQEDLKYFLNIKRNFKLTLQVFSSSDNLLNYLCNNKVSCLIVQEDPKNELFVFILKNFKYLQHLRFICSYEQKYDIESFECIYKELLIIPIDFRFSINCSEIQRVKYKQMIEDLEKKEKISFKVMKLNQVEDTCLFIK